MRIVRDLRIEADRIDMGTALGPMIEAFAMDGDRRIPMGRCWSAFEDLCHELERAAIDRMSETPHAGLIARLVARLTGEAPSRVPLAAEDIARLEGKREALREIRVAVANYVELASRPKAEAAKRDDRLRAMPASVGRSRL